MILSRAPLTAQARCVRLACIRHAASVRPEPGSNSSLCGLERHRSGLRTKRNGSGTCASSRFSCEGTSHRLAAHGRIKNQGSTTRKRADTWRRLWPRGQRVSRKGRKPENRVVASTTGGGETTANTTRRSIARQRDGVKSACHGVRRWTTLGHPSRFVAPSATIPPGSPLVKRYEIERKRTRTNAVHGVRPRSYNGSYFP